MRGFEDAAFVNFPNESAALESKVELLFRANEQLSIN